MCVRLFSLQWTRGLGVGVRYPRRATCHGFAGMALCCGGPQVVRGPDAVEWVGLKPDPMASLPVKLASPVDRDPKEMRFHDALFPAGHEGATVVVFARNFA